jgi:uncharacterized protein (TIGR03437 family)
MFVCVCLTRCLCAQVITTTVGTDWVFPAQSLPADKAPLGAVSGVAIDAKGNVYVADPSNNMVMRVSPDGILTVAAGNGEPSPPNAFTIATGASAYNRPGPRYSGDGGPATTASLSFPLAVAVDAAGNVFIADTSNNRIRKLTTDGRITTVAGGGNTKGDGAQATFTALDTPVGVAVDTTGNLFIAELGTGSVRQVTPGGIVKTLIKTNIPFEGPTGVMVDSGGNVYVSIGWTYVMRVATDGTTSSIAIPTSFGCEDANLKSFPCISPVFTHDVIIQMAADPAGNLYLLSSDGHIYKAKPQFGGNLGTQITYFALTLATQTSFSAQGLAFDRTGNLYIADSGTGRVRKLGTDGNVSVIAGNGNYRFSGDGGPASSAVLNNPKSVAVDASGNLFIADTGNNRVRKVTPDGIITTVAQISAPARIAVDGLGNLYIGGGVGVRKLSGGVLTTVAGTESVVVADIAIDAAGNFFLAHGASSPAAILEVSNGKVTPVTGSETSTYTNRAGYVAVDTAGSLYFDDGSTAEGIVYKLTAGRRETFAGTGQVGYSGDGGPAIKASTNIAGKMVVDAAGNVCFIDYNNNRVRRVDRTGIITSVAGGYFGPLAGDGGAATSATLQYPLGLAMNRSGDIYIADTGNHRIRVVLANAPSAQASPAVLSFEAPSGGVVPAPQSIALQTGIPAMAYTVSVSTQEGNWLSVQPPSGFTPASLLVTADPTGLDPGAHAGTVTIHLPYANPSTLTVAVSFIVRQSLPPKLSVDGPRLHLVITQSGASSQGVVAVGNTGGGSLNFTAAAATDSGGNWLAVTPSAGSVTPISSARLTVSATPGSLPAGVYRGTLTITADSGEQSSVAVNMLVSATAGQILLSQSAIAFQAAPAAGPLTQNLAVLNRGQSSLNWTATVQSDVNWLSVSPGSGSVARPLLDSSNISVSADPSGLAPGLYYGQIFVSGGGNPAQTVTAMLNVAAAGSLNGPQIQPAGLIFTGRLGDAPGSQNVVVRNAGAVPLLYNSARLTLDGADWLQYVPQNANVAAAQPQRIVVQPGFATMAAGVHDGSITFLFGDGSIHVVRISSVVAGPGCTPSRLVMLPTSVEQVFTVTQNLPTRMEVQVVDDCGTALTADRAGAAVTAGFSNGDPSISLIPTGGGYWSNSWQPVNSPNGPVYVTLTASLPQPAGTALAAIAVLEADFIGTVNVPFVSAVMNAASLVADAPLAPGSLYSLPGSGLAGATVNLAGHASPLLLTSGAQINGQTPSDIPINMYAQLIVQAGAAISTPLAVMIAAAAPAVFTQDGSGQGAGMISDGVTGALNTRDNPAHAGDMVTISCTGLGAGPVSVTIGGQPVQAVNVGALPAMPGVEQISVVVPAGVSGDTVPVMVIAGGQASPVVTMAVE